MIIVHGFPFLHIPYYALWEVILKAYVLTLDLNIRLSLKYVVKDEFDEEARSIILKVLS